MTAAPIARVARPSGFATRDLPRSEQVARWEQHNADALVALSCTPPRGRSFDALELNLQLSRVHLARVVGSSHRVERTPDLVEQQPTDAIAVYVSLRGDAVLEHEGRKRVLSPGQLLVCDADRPFVRGFGHGLEELAVTVPRSGFAELTGEATVADPIVLDVAGPGGSRHGRALARLVGRAVRPQDPVPADEQTLLELVGVLAGHGAPYAHRAAARAYIDEHFAEADLSASRIASNIGISDRQLSRIFADAGTSVPRQVLARRLDAAHHLLATTTEPALRTADVAARCGFSSASHFASTFRDRFGVRAGDVRRAAR